MNRDELKEWSKGHKTEVKLETTELEKLSTISMALSMLWIALVFILPLPYTAKFLAVLSLLLSLLLKYMAASMKDRKEKELNEDWNIYAWDTGENSEIDSLSEEEIFLKIKDITESN